MEINLMELWHEMGLPVRTVVIVLTLQAIGCITVTIDRLIMLFQSGKRAQAFAGSVQDAMKGGQYEEALGTMTHLEPSHLMAYMEVGLKTFLGRRRAGDDNKRAAELTRRALERKGDQISRDLNRGMNVIASTGSTAPFVGLLGTVLGIINAFKLIAADGSGGIGTIGAAIGEALIVTGYGLMVAIPAVLLFNMLSSMIAKYEAGLLNAGSELIDQLEVSNVSAVAAQPVAASAAAPRPVSQAPAAQPTAQPSTPPAQQPVSQPVPQQAVQQPVQQPVSQPAPVAHAPASTVPPARSVPAPARPTGTSGVPQLRRFAQPRPPGR